jgi:hypothetical protein
MKKQDLGGGVSAVFELETGTGDPIGATIVHERDGKRCAGYCHFAGKPRQYDDGGKAQWVVQSLEPLTMTPSVVCHCGFHGWVRDGKWVPA